MIILNQIIDDTLKNNKGKWSRKSLTMFVSFNMAIITGITIVCFNLIFDRELNPYAIQVFFGFLALAGGTSAMTVWDKFKNGPDNQKPFEEDGESH
tara:strand:- start:1100 stop:1387 length:288 start_codon:yes stop_codon:yes gene_type:complete